MIAPTSSLPLSREIEEKIRLAEPWVAAVTERFWNHPRLAGVFPEFMVRVYWASQGGVDAMVAAEQSARERATADPVCARLAEYYAHHHLEERAHPGWLLRDMSAVGLDIDEVLGRTPPPSTAALIGSQLYWIRQVHPVALLGHLAVLEGRPPSEEHLLAVHRRTGIPREAFRMMIAHAHIDPAHSAEIDQLLDELSLDQRLRSLVGLSALSTLDRVAAIYEELTEMADAAS